MARFASQEPDQPLRAKDLSEEIGVPVHYLSKILRRLVIAGLLTSTKGHGGGFTLAKPPAQIRFKEILHAVNHGVVSNLCVFGWGKCDKRNPCPLHAAWNELNYSFENWAQTTTLADVDTSTSFQKRKASREK